MPELTCESTRLSGAKCNRPKNHDGPHMEIEPNGVTEWANEQEASR